MKTLTSMHNWMHRTPRRVESVGKTAIFRYMHRILGLAIFAVKISRLLKHYREIRAERFVMGCSECCEW